MCNQVFISATRPLPTIPWVGPGASFHVEPLLGDSHGAEVRRWFTGPYVYRVGSWMGCGCGFRYARSGSRGEQSTPEFQVKGRASVARLREYLAAAVQDGEVEVYAAWLDAERAEPTTRDHVTPDAFGGDSFALGSHAFFRVTATLPPDAPARWPALIKGIRHMWLSREEFEQNSPPRERPAGPAK